MPPTRRRSRERLTHDVATRVRLLDAARHLFAELGFEDVTVRDICREAGANLALVNYHFGDKLGLYHEIVNEAIGSVREFNDLAMNAPEGSDGEARLRHFVRVLLVRVFEFRGADGWVHRLIQHEINRPTDVAKRIMDEAIAPRLRYLAGVVTELLQCPLNDPRVMPCVASVHGLCLVYSRMVIAPERFRTLMPELVPDVPSGQLSIEAAIAHVSAFSLAGIRAMRTSGSESR
ncbi:MAG TPA: CerR family C-terminal domain-containing protein, partial [Kofleriaceae bacterium]|nr:CerR family C-terminal domain-containing protein [Kofleriaceae bacterium]